jgi:DNA-binding CsgD family transcriptional regulator
MNKDVDQINYLAIDLLERLGNSKPTESQIEIMESILLQVVPPRRVFDKTLTLVKIISILLTVKGKTPREIADLLDISQMDVEGDYEEIKNKLNLSAVA